MNIGKAIAIFEQLESDEYTDEEKATAIFGVMNMPTHNSITKADMVKAIKFLWNKLYYIEKPRVKSEVQEDET